MRRRQREYGNGNRRTGHIDGGAQRNRYRIGVFVQIEFFRQRHIDRNIGGRRAGKECGNAAFAQAQQHQRVGVAADFQEHDQRVHHQRHKQHAAHQHQQQLAVFFNHVAKAGGGGGYRYQAENADGGKADNPAHDGGNGMGKVVKHLQCGAGSAAQGETEQHRPQQDADVVGIGQRVERIVHQLQQQRLQHFGDALGRGDVDGAAVSQRQCAGKDKGRRHRHQRSAESAQQVEKQNRPHIGFGAAVVFGDGGGYQNKHQKRCHAFERADKQAAENAGNADQRLCFLFGATALVEQMVGKLADDAAGHQADNNLPNQAEAGFALRCGGGFHGLVLNCQSAHCIADATDTPYRQGYLQFSGCLKAAGSLRSKNTLPFFGRVFSCKGAKHGTYFFASSSSFG